VGAVGDNRRGRNGESDVPLLTQITYLQTRMWRFGETHEAYQPIIDDGRGRFPEDLRVKAPRGARAAIAAAAELKNTSHSEWVRQALLCCLEADGVKLRRGMVELSGAS
jgi:hypothetical protein